MMNNLELAYRLRDVVRSVVREVLREEVPRVRFATVVSVDPQSRTATCQYPDETVTFPVRCGAVRPAVGATVRISGPNGARYVEDVLSGTLSFWS
jgi:hypothetical protein